MKILITWMAYALFMALIGALLGGFRRSIDKTNQKDKENLVDKDDLVWVGLIVSIVLVLIPLLLELAFYFMFISFHGDNVLNVTVVLAAIFFFIGAFLLCTKGALFGNLFTKTQFGMWTGAVLVGLPLTALSLFLFWYTVLFALFG
ncbi:MAG: hypothetical protein L6Q29_05040 [Candidatus Pacebacteria bacterium]|nr:hypothetical protein [Candidatus Paceibacterota bacterium]